jgi:hypothetical protein
MMTTLLWAEKRHDRLKLTEQRVTANYGNSFAGGQATHDSVDTEDSATADLPIRIQKQVGETVLNMMTLTKLEEAYDEGAIRVQFPTGENLEPRHYVYQPAYGGAMRRENPEKESLWFSERVNIGDADTLAERFSIMTTSRDDTQDDDLDYGGEDDQAEHATELADRLVQDWTNLRKFEDTGSWNVDLDQDAINEATDEPAILVYTDAAPVDAASNVSPTQTRSRNDALHANELVSKSKATDLKARYLSARSIRNPRYWKVDATAFNSMTRAEKFEDEMRRIIDSCFAKLDTDGASEYSL